MKHCFVILFFLQQAFYAFATHNRAGEITYEQISAYTYEVTVTTYTYTPSAANEHRDSLFVTWGDGSSGFIKRVEEVFLPDNYTKNTYCVRHTYPSAGVYSITMIDLNRNEGVENIFDSVNIPFSITTSLKIDPILGGNSTPILLNPPVDKAALGERFVHNPAAYDVDGDSLSYSLAICDGEDGKPIVGYEYPEASKEFKVDSVNGDLIWDAPTKVGTYNVAMLVEEWRGGVKIGRVARDIQIEVHDTENKTPEFVPQPEYCVRAGDTLRFTVTANDTNNDNILLTASGGPLEATSILAEFTPAKGAGTVSSEFVWVPSSSEVREQAYQAVFKAQDNGGGISLSAIQYVNIRVIGHPPVNLKANANSISVELSWKQDSCKTMQGFDIYRAVKAVGYTPKYCESGMPAELYDYKLIDSVDDEARTYTDFNSGVGLSPGFKYCYRIITRYENDFESYVSEEICTELKPTFPVMTNVSVEKTHCDSGRVFVAWSKAREFDKVLYPEPYKYILFGKSCVVNQNLDTIAVINGLNDTTFTDSLICTQDSIYSYQVGFYTMASGSEVLIGKPPVSTSPFLSILSSDKTLTLSVQAQVNWHNDSAYVYRSEDGENFDSVGIFNSDFKYVDRGLENYKTYHYYVKTSGYFDYDSLPKRTYNYSQIAFAQPLDTIAPSTFEFTVTQDCKTKTHRIEWKDNQHDVERYNIYFKACNQKDFALISENTSNSKFVEHTFDGAEETMSGCYKVTAIDAVGNESKTDTTICLYTCPNYILPNIFTPNGDGENEICTPHSNSFVQKVDMKIYNSWGQLVFETEDPQLNWDGTHQKTGKDLDDGVFYYVCDVYEYWNTCEIKPRNLSGFIHKFSGKRP